MRTPWTLSPLVAIAAVILASTSAAASCAAPPALGAHLAMADAVFVGTVVELSNADRTAVVSVEEIWYGPALDATVTVHGGPEHAGMATSVDRTYAAGRKYLFAVTVSEGLFEDNSCSATREWTPGLADLRPSDYRQPPRTSEPAETGSLPMGPIAVGAALLAILVGGVSVVALWTRR